jgi:FMN phosphatase YigB (HAD superfamily)
MSYLTNRRSPPPTSDHRDGIVDVRSAACQIRVVTFDLDNTLWNTTVTIDVANDALAKHMNENIVRFKAKSNSTALPLQRVEKVMGKLFAANKCRYCPIDGESSKSPVLLTQLRKDAILYVLREHVTLANETDTDKNNQSILNFAEEAFDVWANARHTAVSSHMASSATEVLQRIQSLPTVRGTQKIVIGAITDGNSDPSLIPELSRYFDFCINAEMVGVSKPNKRIYLEAVARALQQHPTLHDLLPSNFEKLEEGEMSVKWTDDQLEELIGPWWVHIGDDFVKDIVASKSLNMRSIWTKELIVDKIPVLLESIAKPQRTVEELMQVVNEAKIVEMTIGADNYLADSLQEEFSDAVVDRLQDVADIIQKWQSDSLLALKSTTRNSGDFHAQTIQNTLSSELYPIGSPPTKAIKFCISCGTKLPMVAKFCASCGQQQSD